MNVLLIGGSGFLGSILAEHFLASKDRVAILSRGNKALPAGAEAIVGDRKDAHNFASAVDGRSFDLVVDVNAFTAADVQAVTPSLAGKAGHYVLISTDFVYADDIEQIPINEDAPKDSNSPYAIGKLAAEAAMMSAWQEQKLPGTSLRPPHIFGRGKELGSGSLQGRDRNLLRSMQAGTGLTLICEGELLIQPVWHRQIAEACETIAGNSATFGHAMNMPGGEAITTRRYYQLIADRLGVPLKYDSISIEKYRADFPGKRAFARHRVYDTSKLRNLAGYIARPQAKEAIDETVAWMQANC